MNACGNSITQAGGSCAAAGYPASFEDATLQSVTLAAQYVPTMFGLAAVVCWGISDFSGGYAARRSEAFIVTLIAHAGGFVLMLAGATAVHAPFPDRSSELWALAAGALGGSGLALFYEALGRGKMGINAPVAAVLGAGIPTLFAFMTEGLPGPLTVAGFVLAGAGIWLISRQEDGAGPPEGLWLAVIAGCGFAGFFVCIHHAVGSSALWSAVHARVASVIAVAVMILFKRRKPELRWSDAALAVFAGCLDSVGTLLFIRADQTGRLDAAVVLTSLYPAITVLLARVVLKEHFTRWKAAGIIAALAAVPLIATQ